MAATALLPARLPATPPKGRLPSGPTPLPLSAIRLLPSPWADAVAGNRAYLHALEPDRLLHNFRTSAGLEPKGPVYGGWESDTIAGHTLGHYLTALSLMYAQTGDEECRRRVGYIVDELARCQAAHGDGYVAGFTRKRGDVVEDGKLLFPEVMRGDIRSMGFDLNGCWVPFYNWHKLYAGLFDAQDHCGNTRALPVAVALGGYVERVFAALDDAQVQQVLDCEHGGINESFADLYARTGDPRWLRLAERIRHKKILDPLTAGQDVLPWIHANTQIPKIIGLARIYDVGGRRDAQAAPRFFWETVTRDYSYVIGGNADREYFPSARSVSKHITEQTCESCNSYNMLKLTRHLYHWRPEARLFDYYERAHINHILAQQDPRTGMFAYMVPLMSGSARDWSKPYDDFWCCVGSGMESHAKHGDSVWWQGGGDTLIVNLYVPSEARWAAGGATVRMETGYPFGEDVAITLAALARPRRFAVALRIPGWCEGARLAINGESVPVDAVDGYAIVRRTWAQGDRIALTLPMRLRSEGTVDDPSTIALLHGPVVLAADLGPVDRPYDGPAPALVAGDILAGFTPVDAGAGRFRTAIAQPAALTFAPFFQQRDRRTAVYFKSFDDAAWATEQVRYRADQARLKDLAARSVDIMNLGEMQAERDHGLIAKNSYAVTYRGRHGRDARTFGFFEYKAPVRPGPLILQATFWGDERDKRFRILIDGVPIATQALTGARPGEFFEIDYPIPAELTRHKDAVTVRVEPVDDHSRSGPIFGIRIFTPPSSPNAAA